MRRIPLILFLALLPCGCSLIAGPEPWEETEYVMRVSELVVPASVRANAPLDVVATGHLPDGCHVFDRVEADRRGDRMELTFIGFDYSSPTMYCLLNWVQIDMKKSNPPPFRGPTFTVVVNQPDGSQLTREVVVVN